MKINIYTPNDHKIVDKYILDELKKYNIKEKIMHSSNWKKGYSYQIEVEKISELHSFMETFSSFGKNPMILTNSDAEWFIQMRY